MLRLILVAVLVLLVLIGAIAVALFHFFGWKGMVAFPFVVIALIWIGKIVIGKLIKRVALGLFSMKSSALHGATMMVHSIVPVAKPVEAEEQEDEGADADENENGDEKEDEGEADKAAEKDEEKPRHYYAVDLTITPRESGGERVWEPGEFILASEPIKSLSDLEEKEVGSAHQVEVWNGSEFGPDDPGKYPGQQRLRITFAVVPGMSKAWLQYYNETLGVLDVPVWQPIS